MPVSFSPAIRRHRLRNPYGGGSLSRRQDVFSCSSMMLKLAILLTISSPWMLLHYLRKEGNFRMFGNVRTSLITEPAVRFQSKADFSEYFQKSEAMKQEFYRRYGGKESALALLQKTILTFPPSSPSRSSITAPSLDYGLNYTAKRFIHALVAKQPLVFSFGGYSITVGRGNYFNQSYPLVLESILRDTVKSLGIPHLEVRNAAIGGIPSFPYGWCLKNFLGEDSDAVSWDFSMNEGDNADGLESYVRHALSMNNKSPMFIMYGASSRSRRQLLQQYVDSGSALDPIVINYDKSIVSTYVSQPEAERPVGFQQWESWGSPPGCPGQSSWHLKLKEHEFIGWMLAMHFLSAMDFAVQKIVTSTVALTEQPQRVHLPRPITLNDYDKDDTITSLVYGVPKDESSNNHWAMTHVSCKTSFQHSIQGQLDDIVVSGVVQLPDDLDPAVTAQDVSTYASGWVMDVGELERKTKRQLVPYDGLGYIDKKTALYGIPESGTLSLWLPLLPGGEVSPNSLVVCEVNEKRGDHECNMEQDLTFVVGGITSPRVSYLKRTGMAYLGKVICVNVAIPKNISITPRPKHLRKKTSRSSDNALDDKMDIHGITVDITVTGKHVTYKNGACSISHVIWEELK